MGAGTLGDVDGDIEAAADTSPRVRSGGTLKGEDVLAFCPPGAPTSFFVYAFGGREACCGTDELAPPGLRGTSTLFGDWCRVIDFRGCKPRDPGRLVGEDEFVCWV